MGWSTHHPDGLIYYAPQQSYRGYTLITNLRGNDAYLLDMEGRACHRWHLEEGISYGYLLSNGNLLMKTNPPAASQGRLRGARTAEPGARMIGAQAPSTITSTAASTLAGKRPVGMVGDAVTIRPGPAGR